jgi:glutaryl-CoA dehydrogenase
MSVATFHWDDPLLLDQQLTEEERMVRDAARAYAQDKLAPRVTEAFRHERTDAAIFREMGELGLLGPTIPDEYGGPGLNYVSYGLIAREVERVDSGYRSMMSVQSSLVMVPIFEFGSDAQKQKYLPKLATGEWIGCFGLTEPNHGSDPGSMVTREESAGRLFAVRLEDVDHQLADRRRVRRVGEARRKRRGRDPRLHPREGLEGAVGAGHPRQGRAARVDHRRDRARRGVRARRKPDAERERPARPVHVPELGPLRDRWGALGAAESCWHTARQYVLDRKQFGRPLAANQLIQKSSPTCRPKSRSACKACCGWAG